MLPTERRRRKLPPRSKVCSSPTSTRTSQTADGLQTTEKATEKAPDAAPSSATTEPPTPSSKKTDQRIIDFFSSIEENQPTMFDPQVRCALYL